MTIGTRTSRTCTLTRIIAATAVAVCVIGADATSPVVAASTHAYSMAPGAAPPPVTDPAAPATPAPAAPANPPTFTILLLPTTSGTTMDPLSAFVPGTTLTAVDARSANDATVSLINSIIAYVPAAGFVGDDTFSYQTVGPDGSVTAVSARIRVLAPAPNATATTLPVFEGSLGELPATGKDHHGVLFAAAVALAAGVALRRVARRA